MLFEHLGIDLLEVLEHKYHDTRHKTF